MTSALPDEEPTVESVQAEIDKIIEHLQGVRRWLDWQPPRVKPMSLGDAVLNDLRNIDKAGGSGTKSVRIAERIHRDINDVRGMLQLLQNQGRVICIGKLWYLSQQGR